MIKKLDHIELYVANVVQASYFYQNAFGFRKIGYKTDKKDKTSFLLEQEDIRIVLTSTPMHKHDVADHVHTHGDTVKDIVFETENVEELFAKALSHGAQPIQHPIIIESESGNIKKASISTFGKTIHSFIERSDQGSFFLPHFNKCESVANDSKSNLRAIDHFAIAVESDAIPKWQDFYQKIFGFYESYRQTVETKNSGMNSAVMRSLNNSMKFVFVAPLREGSRSQISEFLSSHNGAGVQHIAFSSNDIFQSVQMMKQKGVEFLSIPDSYYSDLPNRLKSFSENTQDLQKSQILLDRDEKGYLLQAFTKPVHVRPTLFFEVVQRKGAEGFGEGNVKALFEAVEKEQMKREQA